MKTCRRPNVAARFEKLKSSLPGLENRRQLDALMRSRKVNTGPERLRARHRRGKFFDSRDTPNERKKKKKKEREAEGRRRSGNSIVPESLFTWTTFREYYAAVALSANATGIPALEVRKMHVFYIAPSSSTSAAIIPVSRKPQARDCVSQILFQLRFVSFPPLLFFRGKKKCEEQAAGN